MGRTAAATALALIVVVVGAEFLWDMAHGSPGTHWLLKLVVLAGAVVGIAALRPGRGSAADGRGAPSPPRPRPDDADTDGQAGGEADIMER